MTQIARIITLVENTAAGPGVLAEHGLSFWIDLPGTKALFDTGQGRVLFGNSLKLGVHLEQTGAIVLSHGHYDHTGGLGDALRSSLKPSLYAHPAAFDRKFARQEGRHGRDIGVPYWTRDSIRKAVHTLVWTQQPTEVGQGLWVTGAIPRVTDFEQAGGEFFLDEDCRRLDPLTDDQALFFETAQGTIVLLGCAHAGVINTLTYVRQLTGGKGIHAVLGGMHLLPASPQRIDKTVAALREVGVRELWPAHCTGPGAWARLRLEFGDACHACPVGTVAEFEIG